MTPQHNVIIYAEDDDDDKILMSEAMEELNSDYLLFTVSNGREAITKLRELTETHFLPCLIVLDGNMPIMTGKEALIEIRKNEAWDDISISIFSTSSETWFDDVSNKKNISVYRKPNTLVDYKKTIQRMLNSCEE